MDPVTIALILPLIIQGLDLAVKLAPEVLLLVQEIKTMLSKNPDLTPTLQQIADGTLQTTAATRAMLADLVKSLQVKA